MGDLYKFFSKGFKVLIQSVRFERNLNSVLLQFGLRSHASRTAIGVTDLRLDAANAHHGLPGNVYHIYAQGKGHGSFGRETQFATPHKDNSVCKSMVLK